MIAPEVQQVAATNQADLFLGLSKKAQARSPYRRSDEAAPARQSEQREPEQSAS